MNPKENVLCVLRDKLDLDKLTHNYEVIDIKKEPDKVILPELGMNVVDDDRFVDVTRGEAENNKKYIQLVVGLILRCNNRYVFMQCKDGMMQGHTTLIQGHVERSKGNTFGLTSFLRSEMVRELYEEISMWNILPKCTDAIDIAHFQLRLKYVAYNNFNSSIPSYYHYGFIYDLDLNEDYEKYFNDTWLVSNEPEKNNVIFVDKDKLKYLKNPDGWTKELILMNNI